MADIKKIQTSAHQNSVDHGFWEGDFNFGEKMMLIVSEAVEAFEHWRDGQDPVEVFYGPGDKPDGVPIELADIMIRVLDLAAYYNMDIERAVEIKMAYNASRPYKHGGKLA